MNLFCIDQHGAKADGITINTRALQAAIDAAHAAGGGVVSIPAGDWVTGTVQLRSGVVLDLAPGARLLGSLSMADYPRQATPGYRSQKDPKGFHALLYAENEEHIGLTGAGTIDGRGAGFTFGGNDQDSRPRLILFISCRDVRVENLRLRDSALWMQHYLNCERLTIRGLHVWNHSNRNNDMMDIDGCRNVAISDCIGDTDDDGITFKSTGPAACENIVLTNCVVSSRCNAIKCGTESTGGFRNLTISNCVVKPTAATSGFYGVPEGSSAISLEIVDGGTLDGVLISNIRVVGTRSPVFIRLGNRARPHQPELAKPGIGALRNVMLQNILVSDAGDIGSSITGLPGHPVENIRLSHCFIANAKAAAPKLWEGGVPEKAEAYPEATMWGALPACGFYVRHANQVSFDTVEIAPAAGDPRPVLATEDVSGLVGAPVMQSRA